MSAENRALEISAEKKIGGERVVSIDCAEGSFEKWCIAVDIGGKY